MSASDDARNNILNAPYDWARWPKLASIFADRPRINVYWLELADFVASMPQHYVEAAAEEEPGIQHVDGCACHRCTRALAAPPAGPLDEAIASARSSEAPVPPADQPPTRAELDFMLWRDGKAHGLGLALTRLRGLSLRAAAEVVEELLREFAAAPPAGVGAEAIEPWVIVAAHLSTEGVAYFWGPKFSGYTRLVDESGRYTEAEAKSREVWSERMEVAVPLSEVVAAAKMHVSDDDAHAWFRRRFPGPKPAPAGTGGRR